MKTRPFCHFVSFYSKLQNVFVLRDTKLHIFIEWPRRDVLGQETRNGNSTCIKSCLISNLRFLVMNKSLFETLRR